MDRDAFEQERKSNSAFSRFRTKFKILTSFYQIVSQYEHVLQIRFPEVFENFGRWVSSLANLDALKLVSFGCLVDTDYHLKLLFSTLTPIIFSLLILLYYLWEAKLKVILRLSQEPLTPADRTKKLDFCMTLFLTLTYLVFASVSTTLFKTFQCETYGDDPIPYLVEDHQVNCETAEHKAYELYAAFMMFVYPFGITALYAFLLYRKREKIADKDRHKEKSLNKIAFLWEMYEPRWWWFEIFECVRRLSMTGMLVFVDPGSPTQIVIAILNSVISIVMYSHLLPFEKNSDDNLAVVSSWSIFFTLFGAFMVRTNVDKHENTIQYTDHYIFGYLLILVNCAGFFLVAAEVALYPAHYILRRCKAVHQHDGELKGLTEEERFYSSKYWEYVEKLLHSDEEEAGWESIEAELKDQDYSDWVNFVDAKTLWRCSEGNGPVDQIRATFTLKAKMDDVFAYLMVTHTHQNKDETSKWVQSYPEKPSKLKPNHNLALKRYYMAKKIFFPFQDRDFLIEEWSGSCAKPGKENCKMVVSRSYVDNDNQNTKSSANLRRTRGKIAIYAFLLEPIGRGNVGTRVTFIGGGFDLRGFLSTDLIGREMYLRLMERVVDELDIKFNEDSEGSIVSGRHKWGSRRRTSGSRKNLSGTVTNAIIEMSTKGVTLGAGGVSNAGVWFGTNNQGLLSFNENDSMEAESKRIGNNSGVRFGTNNQGLLSFNENDSMEAEGKQRRGSVGAMNAESFGKKVQIQKASRGKSNPSKKDKERGNNAQEDEDDNKGNEGLASPSPVTMASLADSLKPPSFRNLGGKISANPPKPPSLRNVGGGSSSRLINHKCSTPDCGSTTDCEKDPLDGKWYCPSCKSNLDNLRASGEIDNSVPFTDTEGQPNFPDVLDKWRKKADSVVTTQKVTKSFGGKDEDL
ncbi:hypothetical protein TrST_g6296 [Triparma strigata]|uniref:Uncharacterized protein n=1 Tax=Triparma strigata TaxID=1606541 RepID=A0A9W7BXE1_9STRA|nr:hypothetical protein TrST_g6296 [Triparma strigata]